MNPQRWRVIHPSGAKAQVLSAFDVAAEEAAEKSKTPSFRGMLLAEESLILLTPESRGIPRFARNDGKREFFRSR